MTNPLGDIEAEMARISATVELEAIPGLPAGVLEKISDVTRANALVQLAAMMSDETRDDMVRMGAMNIALQATQPLAHPPVVEVHPLAVKDEPDVEESE